MLQIFILFLGLFMIYDFFTIKIYIVLLLSLIKKCFKSKKVNQKLFINIQEISVKNI